MSDHCQAILPGYLQSQNRWQKIQSQNKAQEQKPKDKKAN